MDIEEAGEDIEGEQVVPLAHCKLNRMSIECVVGTLSLEWTLKEKYKPREGAFCW